MENGFVDVIFREEVGDDGIGGFDVIGFVFVVELVVEFCFVFVVFVCGVFDEEGGFGGF